MKKTVLSMLIFIAAALHAAEMGKFDPDSKNWKVGGDHFSCTFFQGCLYPAWFRSPAGAEFPFFVFDDVFTVDGETYLLREERWAEHKIVKNTADQFVIECTGNFCTGKPPQNTPCKEILTTYRYTLRKDSPVMKIEILMEKEKTVPVNLSLMRLRWRFLPFSEMKQADGTRYNLRQRPAGYDCGRIVLLHPAMNLAPGFSKTRVSWLNRENGFLYVTDRDADVAWQANQKTFRHSTQISFEKEDGK